MKKISILQETIEVCEHFRLNPYQMISTGSFLAVTDNGEVLADALNNQGITAAVIGHTTDNNDKILRNGEEMRYIDRPAPDEILKLYSGGMNDGRIKKADTPVSGEAQQGGPRRTGSSSWNRQVTVANEISAMERAKIICGYHTLIDWDKTGTEYVNALIEVK